LYPCFIFTKDDYSKGELDWKPRWTTRGITADTLPLQGIIFIPEEHFFSYCKKNSFILQFSAFSNIGLLTGDGGEWK